MTGTVDGTLREGTEVCVEGWCIVTGVTGVAPVATLSLTYREGAFLRLSSYGAG